MRPSEFWSLSPGEFWWMLEANKPPVMYGDMTENEVASLYRKRWGEPPSGE